MLKENTVYVTTLVGNDATVSEVHYGEFLDDKFLPVSIVATGVSKRFPGDKNDPDVARDLAIGRALESLGKKLQKRANSVVKHVDDIREMKTVQGQRKIPKKIRK